MLHFPRARRAVWTRKHTPGHSEELVVPARAAIYAVVLDDLPWLEGLGPHQLCLHAGDTLRTSGQRRAARRSETATAVSCRIDTTRPSNVNESANSGERRAALTALR